MCQVCQKTALCQKEIEKVFNGDMAFLLWTAEAVHKISLRTQVSGTGRNGPHFVVSNHYLWLGQ